MDWTQGGVVGKIIARLVVVWYLAIVPVGIVVFVMEGLQAAIVAAVLMVFVPMLLWVTYGGLTN